MAFVFCCMLEISLILYRHLCLVQFFSLKFGTILGIKIGIFCCMLEIPVILGTRDL